MELKQAVISHPQMVEKPDDPEVTAVNELICEYFSAFLAHDENCNEPNAFWLYPVIDKVDYIDVTSDPKFPQDYEVKGLVVTNVYWKHLIRNILPLNSRGVVIVFEYAYTKEVFTYQIDGPVAEYMGSGDKHDPKYDKMKISRRLNDLDAYRSGVSKYYGLPLHSGGNKTYTVHIYPSDDMKSSKLPQFYEGLMNLQRSFTHQFSRLVNRIHNIKTNHLCTICGCIHFVSICCISGL
jgi:hypothetical protein